MLGRQIALPRSFVLLAIPQVESQESAFSSGWRFETSDDTVLRRVKQAAAEPVEATPIRNLGVDDWAWRKGLDFREALASCEAWRMMVSADFAKYSQFGPLVRFAYGLQKDVSAINAAVVEIQQNQ